MAQLTAAVGKSFSADEILAWYNLLRDLDDAALEAGFGRASRECKAFPSVALIREFAADAQYGVTSTVPDVWPKVLKAVRYFGFARKAEARAAIPPLVWKALGGDIGWEWLCEMGSDQRSAYAAQFRDRYRELRSAEERDRRLPESLRPRIDNTPVAGLPEQQPSAAALPAPSQPSTEQIEAARLKVFRSVEPASEPVDVASIEANRQQQIEAARRMAETRRVG